MVALQQSGYFWKFLWAVELLNYFSNKPNLLKKYNISQYDKITNFNLFKSDIYKYLPNKCIIFTAKKKGTGAVCFNQEWFTFNKILHMTKDILKLMDLKGEILVPDKKYVVKKWDSLWKIWSKFKLGKKWISFSDFKEFNQISFQKIDLWQVLVIPKKVNDGLYKLPSYKQKKILVQKILDLLKKNYVVRTYDVVKDSKPTKVIYIFRN